MLVLQRNTFHLERDIHHAAFTREMPNLCHDIVEAIEERVPEIAGDMQLAEDDVTLTNLTNAMLWRFVAFVTQRPDMPSSEILDIRQVDHEAHAAAFFQQAPTIGIKANLGKITEATLRRGDSSVGESILSDEKLTNIQVDVRQPTHEVSSGVMDYGSQVKDLENRIASLEAENVRLKAQNEALERHTADRLRYKPRKPNRAAFASLDSYIETAVATAVQQAMTERGL